jgi:hypothetical protein
MYRNYQIIKVNDDSSIKVEYLKINYMDISNPDNLKGDDLLNHIAAKVLETEIDSDFLDPELGVMEALEINNAPPEESYMEIPEPVDPSITVPDNESESTDPV